MQWHLADRPWSRVYHTVITWLRGADHVTVQSMITWLIMHWYRDWACTDHVPGVAEAFHSGHRSWGRRLGIRKCGVEPQEATRIFSSKATEDMEESKTFFAKWKKAVWKGYILNESKYTSGNTWKRKNCSDNKKISSFQEPRKKVKKRKEMDKVEAICRALNWKKRKKGWGQEEKGTTEDGWLDHRLNGHGFGWILGVGDGQGGLVCCGSWGCKESDTTERLNWTELKVILYNHCNGR